MPKLKDLDDADNLYNPSSERANSLFHREQKTGEESGINTDIDQTQTNGQANSTRKNIDDINTRESGSGNIPNGFYKPNTGASPEKKGRRYLNFVGPISLRKKGPLAFIIALLLLSAGGPLALLPLGPIMFVENIVRDLNDQVDAMDDRFLWMARNKVPKVDREKALKGCGTVVTIRCKFATIGTKQIEKLKYAGITVEGNSSRIPGRTVPETYTFRGEKFTASEWGNLLNGKEVTRNGTALFKKGSTMHSAAMRAQRVANNARYSSVSDKSFLNHVYKRFGISKKAPELSGKTKAERVNALLNKANSSNVGDLVFTPVEEDGKVTGYTLEGCTSNCNYTPEQHEKMQKSINALKTAKPPSSLKTLGIGALSVTGYWDLACTVSNTITAATIAAKMGNLSQSIQYVSPVLAAVQKIKAGEGTYEDGQTVGEFFGDADNRKMVSDVAALAEVNQENFNQDNISSLGNIDIPEGANPNYGKNALDSELYKMSSKPGTVAPQTETSAQFSLGYGQSDLLALAGKSSSFIQDVVNLGSNGATCDYVQSWWVRGIGLIGGIALLATGVGTGPKIAQAAATTAIGVAVLYGLNAIINKALSNNLVEEANLESDKVARGDLAWTGTAGMMQEGAKARGMVPSDSNQITAYRSGQNATNLAYDDIERSQVTNQLDINNQFSFMGTVSRSILGSVSTSSSVFAGMNIVKDGFSLLTTPTYAETVNSERFKKCDDEAYKEMGIEADVQCNVRYFMPEKELALDTDVVAQWMEEQACGGSTPTCVNAETGLPEGYTPPEPAVTQTGAMATIQGVGSGLLDSFTPDDYPNDYAKFLQFCAYRALPYGETGDDGDSAGRDWETGKKCRDTTTPQMSYFRIYTLDKTIQEAEDGEGIENTSTEITDTGAGLSLRVATFNAGGEPKANQAAIDKMAKTLMEKQPDIVGFQEFDPDWRNAALDIDKVGVNYATYPKNGSIAKSGVDPMVNAILYNADEFDVIEESSGIMPNLKYFDGSTLNSPYVLLQERTTGAKLYVLNTHDPAGSKDESKWDLHIKLRYENAKQHVKFIESLEDGIPIVFPGDFNSGYSLRNGTGNDTYGDKAENLAYCILTKEASLNDAYDVAESRPKKCPNPGNENSVDHIFLSEGIAVSKYFRAYGGDVHDSHYADISIGGTGSGELAWPLDEKYWKANRADFLGPHTASSGTWTNGIDRLAADIGNPPDGSAVYAMLGGTVSKADLGGHGLAIKSKVDGGEVEIAYAHGPRENKNTTYNAGDKIMEIGCLGNCDGGHLHIDISFTPTGGGKRGICPQDVFLAMDKNETVDWNKLSEKAVAPCGRS